MSIPEISCATAGGSHPRPSLEVPVEAARGNPAGHAAKCGGADDGERHARGRSRGTRTRSRLRDSKPFDLHDTDTLVHDAHRAGGPPSRRPISSLRLRAVAAAAREKLTWTAKNSTAPVSACPDLLEIPRHPPRSCLSAWNPVCVSASSLEVAVGTVFDDRHPRRLHVHASGGRWWHDARVWLREAICGLRGHDLLLHFASHRIWLECSVCGHQTSGWRLAASRRPDRRRK